MPQAIPAVIAAIKSIAVAAGSAAGAVTGSVAVAKAVTGFVGGALSLGAIKGGMAASIGAVVGTTLLSAGVSALAPKPPVARAQLQTTVGTLGPRKWVAGRCAVGGHSLTPTPMQSASGKISTVAYATGGCGPVGPLEGLWFGSDFVTFQPNGAAIGKWAPALGCVHNKGYWDQAALTLPSNHPVEWTSQHWAAGCATTLFWIKTDAKEFQRNSIEQPRFLWRADEATVVDPRTGEPATYSNGGYNRACVAYTYVKGLSRNSERLQGMFLSDDEIDIPVWQYWATVCDTNGWRFAGEISAGDDKNATLEALCFGGGAVPISRAGKLSLLISAPAVSVLTVTDDDWIGLPELASANEKFALFNSLIPRFAHEPARFDIVDGTPIEPAAWLEEDDGIRRSNAIEVPWCTWATQAGQIVAYAGYNDREPLTLTGTLMPNLRYSVLNGDCFTWQSARLGASIKFKVVETSAINPDMSVSIVAITETDAKHVLALGTETLPAPRQALPPFDPSLVPQPASGIWSLAAAQITAGGTVLPVLRVTRSAGELDTLVTQVIVRHRLNGATGWLSEYLLDASALSVEIGEVTPGTAYQVGIWYVNANGATSASPRILGPVTTGSLVAGQTAAQPANLLPGGGPLVVPGRPGAGWLGPVGERWQITESNLAYYGLAMWKRDLDGAVWDDLLSPSMAVSAGEVVSALVTLGRFGTWSAGDVGAALHFYGADGAPIGSPVIIGWALDGVQVGPGVYDVKIEGITAPVGAVDMRFSTGVANGAGSGYAAFWRAKVNRGPIAFPWSDEATTGRLWEARIGENIITPGGDVAVPAEILNAFVPRLEGPNSTVVEASFTGAVLSGQLPRLLTVRRWEGDTDVSALSSWSLVATGCTATVSAGVVTITAVTATGSITVTSVKDGLSLSHQIGVVRNLAAPPATGGGGATTAVDTTIDPTSSATLVTCAGPLTVRAGAAGLVGISAGLSYTTSSAGISAAAGRVRYRALPGGAWTWASGAEISAERAASGSPFEPEEGYIDLIGGVIGLTSGTDYEFELQLRRATGTGTLSFFGNFAVEAS